MLQLKIFFVGKARQGWIQEAVAEYGKRLHGQWTLEWIPLADDGRLVAAVTKEGRVIGLDPRGKAVDSLTFSDLIYREIEQSGSRLTFAIGGPEGLPVQLRDTLPLISLSPLTLTHELARVVLAEQIFRAAEIRRGSPYHK